MGGLECSLGPRHELRSAPGRARLGGQSGVAVVGLESTRPHSGERGMESAGLADWLVGLITRAMAADRFELLEGLSSPAPLLNYWQNSRYI